MIEPRLIAEYMTKSIVIAEDLESKMPQLITMLQSRKSRYKEVPPEQLEQMIRDVTFYDPTPTNKYAVYMVTQLKFGNVEVEDAQRMGEAIEMFLIINRSPKAIELWRNILEEEPPKTVLEYRDWRKLEKDTEAFKSKYFYSKKDKAWKDKIKSDEKEELASGAKIVGEFTVNAEEGAQEVRILEITEPSAAVVYGTGTVWCTRLLETDPERIKPELGMMTWDGKTGTPNMAASHMRKGPLYQIYLNGKPWMQITHDMRELKNADNHILTSCSSFTDFVLSHLYDILDKTPSNIKSINVLRKMCVHPNYNGRPPLVNDELAKDI